MTIHDHMSYKLTLRNLNESVNETLPHSPDSRNTSPTDYHLLKHFDNFLNGVVVNEHTVDENAFVISSTSELEKSRNK